MKVPFDQKAVKDCICTQCPVQIRSACSREKEKSSKGKDNPKPSETPRLYCSGGKSSCKDIDTNQMCICGACLVWHKHKLASGKPSMHFCRDGKA